MDDNDALDKVIISVKLIANFFVCVGQLLIMKVIACDAKSNLHIFVQIDKGLLGVRKGLVVRLKIIIACFQLS